MKNKHGAGRGMKMAILLALMAPGIHAEEIPDLTNGGVPMCTNTRKSEPSIDWALGPLGVNGWGYSRKPEEGGSDKARQLLITLVDKKGPSKGLLEIGDVIIGTNGVKFSKDVRKALAEAINQAETEEAGGKLNLMVWRPAKAGATTGTVSDVVVTIPVMGSYSNTAPYDCPKTQRIIDNAVAYIKANKATLLGSDVYSCINGMALMATGREDVMPLVREQAHSMILDPEEKLSIEQHVSMQSWNWSYRAVFLSEYYLLTKDKAVLPTIDEYVTKIAMGQSGAGTWGHSFAARENTGYLHGPLAGYGALNQVGMTCMLALNLGKKCGIENQEIHDAIKRGDDFFSYFIGKGAIPYGEDEPYMSFDDNGKCAQAAIMFEFLNRKDGVQFYSEMVLGDAPRGRDMGHTGCYWSQLWGGIGAARAGAKGLQSFMKEMDFIFTLERQHDGRFVYQGNTGAAASPREFGKPKDKSDCTGARLLQLCFPLRKLYLTGKETPVESHLTDARIDQVLKAGRIKINPDAQQALSKEEITAMLTDPMPAIRALAVDLMQNRKIEMGDSLVTMLDDKNPNARRGAAEALRKLGAGNPAAVKKLMEIIETTDDARLRVLAINALWSDEASTGLAKFAKDAIPLLLKITTKRFEDDPSRAVQFATAKALFSKFGLLKYHKIESADRPLLVPAVREWLSHPNARTGQLVSSTVYDLLTKEEVEQLWKDVYRSSRHSTLAAVGRTGEISADGITLLAKHRAEEGLNLAVWYIRWQRQHGSKLRIPRLLDAIESYGAHAKPFLPYLEEHLAYYKANAKGGSADSEDEVSGDESGSDEPAKGSKKAGKKDKEDPVKIISASIEKIRNSNDQPALVSIRDSINPKDIPYSKDAAKPKASAGAPLTVRDDDGDGMARVTLDGTGSSDAEGVIVSYIWMASSATQRKAQEIARGPSPSVILPVGTHELTLTIYDTDGYSATATTTVTITK